MEANERSSREVHIFIASVVAAVDDVDDVDDVENVNELWAAGSAVCNIDSAVGSVQAEGSRQMIKLHVSDVSDSFTAKTTYHFLVDNAEICIVLFEFVSDTGIKCGMYGRCTEKR